MTLPPVPLNIRTAKIWHCNYQTLAPVAELVNLETLVIATFPDNCLDFLSELTQLRFLSIMHFAAREQPGAAPGTREPAFLVAGHTSKLGR